MEKTPESKSAENEKDPNKEPERLMSSSQESKPQENEKSESKEPENTLSSSQESKPPQENEKSENKESENSLEPEPQENEKDDIEENIESEKYPIGIFFILGTEFCERFTFYGLRTVLTLYLTFQLMYSEQLATAIFHAFIAVAYFSPVLGAVLADSWVGKYLTIFLFSVLYFIGVVTLTVGAVPMLLMIMKITSLTGLMLVGLGTGGIKPCVSAFGGDQFSATQVDEQESFFSVFYFAINSGSLLSTFITPILREDVHCLGRTSCFSLAFGVPALLMLIALVVFAVGKPLYKIHKEKENQFIIVSKCICYALFQKVKSKGEKKEHWLDYAEDKYDRDKIQDIKSLLNIIFLYLPLPVYWALNDQSGSKWILQANKMDGNVFGFHIKPDHTQLVNPIMILALIPLFDKVIYPPFTKLNLMRPLQRMVIGGLLLAFSTFMIAVIQIFVEKTFPELPKEGFSELTIINNTPCTINLTGPMNKTIDKFHEEVLRDLTMDKESSWTFTPKGCNAQGPYSQKLTPSSAIESMMISLENRNLKIFKDSDIKEKSRSGFSDFRIFFSTTYAFTKNDDIMLEGPQAVYVKVYNGSSPTTQGMTDYTRIRAGTYKIFFPAGKATYREKPVGTVKLRTGGRFIIAIYQNSSEEISSFQFTVVKPNSVHLLHQVIPITIQTAGEVMFSITGLSFSYSQSAPSMKSVAQAVWLMTVAFGNIIVVCISRIHPVKTQSGEFFLYAVIMTVDMLLFAVMSYFYKYVSNAVMPKKSEVKIFKK